MKRVILIVSLTMLVVCSCTNVETANQTAKRASNLKVVVVTGGHGFKRQPFFAIFEDAEGVEYAEAIQQDHSEIFEDISGWDYDVIVLYNMTQEISPQRRENFLELLDKGVGLVALHHSIGAFQNWPEYRRIIGARFYLGPMEEDGVTHGKSGYKHDIDIPVCISDKRHPITSGMSDFSIFDEVYNECAFESDNHVLLTTDHPISDKPLAWVRKCRNARVCYIQLGHGIEAYGNPNYKRLVARAIKWSAGRLN